MQIPSPTWNSSTACSCASTTPTSSGAWGTFHSFTVQSELHETTDSPSGTKDRPRTAPVCPTSRRSVRFCATSHTRTMPSADPDTRLLIALGLRQRDVTPSSCGKAATKGFANTRSSFAALRARVYSCAFSNCEQTKMGAMVAWRRGAHSPDAAWGRNCGGPSSGLAFSPL